MAGSASGWHKMKGGPLKGQKVFISKATAAAAGATPAQLAEKIDGGSQTALRLALQAAPLAGVAAGPNTVLYQGSVSGHTYEVAVPLLLGHTASSDHLADPAVSVLFQKQPAGKVALNGIPLTSAPADCWKQHQDVDVGEPELPELPTYKVYDKQAGRMVSVPKARSTGAIVVEPDGRLWVYEPKNHFSSYYHTFPKGRLENGLSLQQNARKEVREELGLDIEITGFVGDANGSTTMTRYYLARRIGGTPADAHWEAANVKLVVPETALKLLNRKRDRKLLTQMLSHQPASAPLVEDEPETIPQPQAGQIMAAFAVPASVQDPSAAAYCAQVGFHLLSVANGGADAAPPAGAWYQLYDAGMVLAQKSQVQPGLRQEAQAFMNVMHAYEDQVALHEDAAKFLEYPAVRQAATRWAAALAEHGGSARCGGCGQFIAATSAHTCPTWPPEELLDQVPSLIALAHAAAPAVSAQEATALITIATGVMADADRPEWVRSAAAAYLATPRYQEDGSPGAEHHLAGRLLVQRLLMSDLAEDEPAAVAELVEEGPVAASAPAQAPTPVSYDLFGEDIGTLVQPKAKVGRAKQPKKLRRGGATVAQNVAGPQPVASSDLGAPSEQVGAAPVDQMGARPVEQVDAAPAGLPVVEQTLLVMPGVSEKQAKVPVAAKIHAGFAVYKDINGTGYTLGHVASGYPLAVGFASEAAALDALEIAEASPVDWAYTTKQELKANQTNFQAAATLGQQLKQQAQQSRQSAPAPGAGAQPTRQAGAPPAIGGNELDQQTAGAIPTQAAASASGSGMFPASPDNLQVVQALGGTTGAVLVRDGATGATFVRKAGDSGGKGKHVREEAYADAAYRALGVPTAPSQLYETAGGPVKLSAYLPGKILGGGSKSHAQLQQHFAADALLANWDVIGEENDNILIGEDGVAYRIDNGGALRYRAQGVEKGAAWNEFPLELWSMRSKTNPQAYKVFGSLGIYAITGQIESISAKQQALINVLPAEVAATIQARLGHLRYARDVALQLQQSHHPESKVDAYLKNLMTNASTGTALPSIEAAVAAFNPNK